jgi:hypothetical protein
MHAETNSQSAAVSNAKITRSRACALAGMRSNGRVGCLCLAHLRHVAGEPVKSEWQMSLIFLQWHTPAIGGEVQTGFLLCSLLRIFQRNVPSSLQPGNFTIASARLDLSARQIVPAQPVDATPSNQLIHKNFRRRTVPFDWSRPTLASVAANGRSHRITRPPVYFPVEGTPVCQLSLIKNR